MSQKKERTENKYLEDCFPEERAFSKTVIAEPRTQYAGEANSGHIRPENDFAHLEKPTEEVRGGPRRSRA